MLRRTSFILVAKTFLETILASTLASKIGLKENVPFIFFQRVITACFWESDISPLAKHSLTQLTKGSLIIAQHILKNSIESPRLPGTLLPWKLCKALTHSSSVMLTSHENFCSSVRLGIFILFKKFLLLACYPNSCSYIILGRNVFPHKEF